MDHVVPFDGSNKSFVDPGHMNLVVYLVSMLFTLQSAWRISAVHIKHFDVLHARAWSTVWALRQDSACNCGQLCFPVPLSPLWVTCKGLAHDSLNIIILCEKEPGNGLGQSKGVLRRIGTKRECMGSHNVNIVSVTPKEGILLRNLEKTGCGPVIKTWQLTVKSVVCVCVRGWGCTSWIVPQTHTHTLTDMSTVYHKMCNTNVCLHALSCQLSRLFGSCFLSLEPHEKTESLTSSYWKTSISTKALHLLRLASPYKIVHCSGLRCF